MDWTRFLTWRAAMIALISGAGMVATALFVGIVVILWKGGFAATNQPAVVEIFGRGLLAMAALMGAAMVGLLLAGPLGRVKIQKGDCEVDLEGKPGD